VRRRVRGKEGMRRRRRSCLPDTHGPSPDYTPSIFAPAPASPAPDARTPQRSHLSFGSSTFHLVYCKPIHIVFSIFLLSQKDPLQFSRLFQGKVPLDLFILMIYLHNYRNKLDPSLTS
jgi:hypothetical protein